MQSDHHLGRLIATKFTSSALEWHAARRSFAQGNAAEARGHCLRILSAAPRHAGALHLLGVIAHQAGDWVATEEYLRQAAQAPEAESLHLLSYAEICRRSVDPPGALDLTRRALDLDPGSTLGWYSFGTQLLEAREYSKSRASLERARCLDPAFWRARAQLAVLAARLGNTREALECFEEVLSERPTDAEVVAQYAGLLCDLGRQREALMQIERAILMAPDTLDHRLRAADIEIGLGRAPAALARLEAVESRFAQNPRLLATKATLLRLTDRIEEAVTLCRDAIARGVQSPDLWRAYGRGLHLAGGEAQALAALERAAGQRPALALSEKAVVLSELGRVQEALEAFDRALTHEPALVDAWYDKAHAKSYRRGDPDIARMERLLGLGCSYRDRMLLHFALGKAYFEAGDSGAAFDHWLEGNRQKRALIDYDSQAACRELQCIGTAAVCELDEPAPGSARDSRLPVFLVGMPRCGSSLIEQILAAHPDIHGGGEQMRLRDLFAPSCLNPTAMGDHVAIERIAVAAIAVLRRSSGQCLRVVDKDLANFKYLGVIRRVFPNARVIHCRRNALDTCLSAYTKLFLGDFPYTYELGELGQYYSGYRSLMDHWRRTLSPECFLEVEYETLVSDPRETVRTLLDFLALPWSEACLRFFEVPRRVSTASFAQVRSPIYRSSVGRGEHFRSRLAPLIETLGR